jgi:hypothetical protein
MLPDCAGGRSVPTPLPFGRRCCGTGAGDVAAHETAAPCGDPAKFALLQLDCGLGSSVATGLRVPAACRGSQNDHVREGPLLLTPSVCARFVFCGAPGVDGLFAAISVGCLLSDDEQMRRVDGVRSLGVARRGKGWGGWRPWHSCSAALLSACAETWRRSG